MKTSNIILVLAVIVILAGVAWQLIFKKPIAPVPPPMLGDATVVSYQDETGSVWSLAYAGDKVQVTIDGEVITAEQVVAASGAKYEDKTTHTVVWSKGNEVTVTRGQSTLFVGAKVETETTESTDTVDTNETTTSDSENEMSADEIVNQATTTASTTDNTHILIGTWRWVRSVDTEGVVTTPEKDVFALTFAADGTVSGQTDCNGFGGLYTYDAGALTVTDTVSTLMFCEDSEESLFVGLVTDSATTNREGDTLTITTATGNILTFVLAAGE